ncbi:MAG: alpha/beta fold hydrolase [Bryobacteraceae bacterium]
MKIGLLGQVKGNLSGALAELESQARNALARNGGLPHIVYLHGILGSHLARPGTRRYWFDLERVIRANFAEELGLAADGLSPVEGKKPVQPAGHLEAIYKLAELRWTLAGFRVHAFAFDWRKSIHVLAADLHNFLESIRDVAPKVALVGHSMGGLVACEYANRHAGWSDRVERAVFLGSPLRGSFAPMEAFTGDFRVVRLLAAMAAGVPDANLRLRRMARTLPGLIDMLPDPAVFPSAEPLYSEAVWTDGVAPAQRWLDQSRALKPRIAGSPLLTRASALVAKQIPTPVAAAVNGKPAASEFGTGDGIVPLKSSAPPGLTAFEVRFPHTALPLDPSAIQAVPKVIRGDAVALRKVDPAEGSEKPAVLEKFRLLQRDVDAIRNRVREGRLLDLDALWLLTGGYK